MYYILAKELINELQKLDPNQKITAFSTLLKGYGNFLQVYDENDEAISTIKMKNSFDEPVFIKKDD